MKKLLLGASVFALVTAATAEARVNTNAMYAGLKVDYAIAPVEYESKNNAGGNFKTKEVKNNGFEADILFGQNFDAGSFVYGFEFQVGHGFSNTRKTWDNIGSTTNELSIKTARHWKFGLDARLGKVFNDIFFYGRLGLHTNRVESKLAITDNAGVGLGNKTHKFWNWSIVPGVGAEWSFAQGVNGRFEYTYEHGLSQSDVKMGITGGTTKKIDVNETRSHVLSLGVSFDI